MFFFENRIILHLTVSVNTPKVVFLGGKFFQKIVHLKLYSSDLVVLKIALSFWLLAVRKAASSRPYCHPLSLWWFVMMRASPGDNKKMTGRRVEALRRMKIMLSISPFDCRGLIYQARSRRFRHGFDESNPYARIYITRDGYFHGSFS